MVRYHLIIFAALDREVAELQRKLSRVLVDGPFGLWAGCLGTSDVLLVRTGIGPEAASAAARRVLERAQADAAVGVGTCGGLVPELEAGQLVLATSLVDGDREECFAVDPALLERAVTAATTAAVVHRAPLVTVGHVVATAEDKAALARETRAVAVDMESASLARVCTEAGVPFAAVRAVLDLATEAIPAHPDGPLVDDAGRPHWTRLLAVAARDPMLPMGLTRLWRRERVARAALEMFVHELCQDRRREAS